MRTLADQQQIASLIQRLHEELAAEMQRTGGPWAIVGIHSRGDTLAKRLAEKLKPDYTGSVDITLYRDDLSEVGPQPIVRMTDIDFPVDGTQVLLVDDVLMSGRSVRAALQSIIDFGRPRAVRLAVLVDRGGRELPIRPDFVGLRVNTDADQHVKVHLTPTDADDRILVFPRDSHPAPPAAAPAPPPEDSP